MKMKIGDIELGKRPIFLAPMEDVTDIGFRLLCKRFGASMVYTEFVSAEALVRDVKSTIQKLTIAEEERPVGIQIYGRDVDAMVEAAKIVEQAKPDVIDLNFGCPVKKVAGKGAGAGMLQNIPKMLEITRKVVDAVHLRMDEPEEIADGIEGQMEFHVGSWNMNEKPLHAAGGFEPPDGKRAVRIFRSFQNGADVRMPRIGAHQQGDGMAVLVGERSCFRPDDVRLQNAACGDW